MKVALVHDYLTRFGGAERVLTALAEVWPQAPVYTSLAAGQPGGKVALELHTSFLQRIPLALKTYKIFSPLYPAIFESFDLSEFDAVISLGYFAKGVLTTPEQLHINYCHTPPRFLYGYPTETRLRERRWSRALLAPVDHLLRIWDFYSAQRPDYIVANSRTVAARVKKLWARDAQVIYPPVVLPMIASDQGAPNSRPQTQDLGYFLVVSRLEPYKNVDLVVRACNQLQLPLKVVGEGSELRRLGKLAGPTVEVLGQAAEEGLPALYNGCRALIVAARDEDFGITPVEAMGYGKPVIALASGGFTETVLPGKTGLFFDQATVESLVGVLGRFEPQVFQPEVCRAQAERFSKERFQQEFRGFVGEKWSQRLLR